ncbi:hypothetical protein KU620_18845, partial [Salmonella enterica subsp. enterica serovar Mbandaka]|nr:hypothetical protein [Salmonella enterica subsp. enterica serovar Mbandaka]
SVVVCSGLRMVIRPALALNDNNKLQNINRLPFTPNLSMSLFINHDYLVAFSRTGNYSNHINQF